MTVDNVTVGCHIECMNSDDTTYSIGEVAELTGISRRTVRFYVQQGLIDPPLGKGRGRHYTQRHIEQINRTRQLQRHGVTLAQISASELGDDEGTPAFAQTIVTRLLLGPGVALEIDSGSVTLTNDQLQTLAARCAEALASVSQEETE